MPCVMPCRVLEMIPPSASMACSLPQTTAACTFALGRRYECSTCHASLALIDSGRHRLFVRSIQDCSFCGAPSTLLRLQRPPPAFPWSAATAAAAAAASVAGASGPGSGGWSGAASGSGASGAGGGGSAVGADQGSPGFVLARRGPAGSESRSPVRAGSGLGPVQGLAAGISKVRGHR